MGLGWIVLGWADDFGGGGVQAPLGPLLGPSCSIMFFPTIKLKPWTLFLLWLLW